MTLGLLSAILDTYEFRQVVDLCNDIGFRAVELACWPKGNAQRRYAGVTHLDLQKLSPAQLEAELAYAQGKQVDISALCYYPNPLSPNREERETALEHLRLLIQTAADTGIGMVNTFIGRDKNKTVEENLIAYKESWSPLVDFAEQKNVKIAIENCPMLFSKDEWPGGNNLAASPALWDTLFRIIDSKHLGLNYDPSHLVIFDMDYLKPLYQFKDKIFHIHLKDVHIDREKLDYHGRQAYPLDYMAPTLPGLGDIDWGKFCAALKDTGYDGYACVEIEDKNFEADAATVRQGIELARQNVVKYF
jgi:Sugar phosphate isomerases/epimerases